jgi:hypothetical protein
VVHNLQQLMPLLPLEGGRICLQRRDTCCLYAVLHMADAVQQEPYCSRMKLWRQTQAQLRPLLLLLLLLCH